MRGPILFLFLLFWGPVARGVDFKKLDNGRYLPQAQGVKDLTFSIERSDLLETIRKGLLIKNMSNLYARVYWRSPGQMKIEIEGPPGRFTELKQAVMRLLIPYVQFALPGRYEEQYSSYRFVKIQEGDVNVYRGVDPTYRSAVPEVKLFLKGGQLSKIQSQTSQGQVITQLGHTRPKNLPEKVLLQAMTSTISRPGGEESVDYQVTYGSFDGYYFPEKVVVKNKVVFAQKDNQGPPPREEGLEVIFGRYEINKGHAQKFFESSDK